MQNLVLLYRLLMWCAVWLMVGMLGRWVDGEKEELDLVPSGCCDWPSCYDPRTQLCLDACRSLWTQCPSKLVILSCYSKYMSPFGPLPVQCFPDTLPHLDAILAKGLVGNEEQVREKIHKLMNVKSCHHRTGICRT